MDSEIKLKPCPFCGEKDAIGIESYKSSGIDWFYVTCHECMAQGTTCGTEQDAVDTWNWRAEQTGEWLEDEYGYCRCSRCGYEHDQPETATPYCPECGARMGGMTEVTED